MVSGKLPSHAYSEQGQTVRPKRRFVQVTMTSLRRAREGGISRVISGVALRFLEPSLP